MLIINELPNNTTSLSVYIGPLEYKERELLKAEIEGRRWDPAKKHWVIPYTRDTLERIHQLFTGNYQLGFRIKRDLPTHYTPVYAREPIKKRRESTSKSNIPLRYQNAIEALEQDLILRRYSFATIKSYKQHLKQLFWYYNHRKPSTLTIAEIKAFLLHKIKNERMAERTQNQAINAFKYFYENIVGKEKMFIQIRRPRKPKDKPHYLTQNEVTRLISSVNNLKHKAILMTIYAAGLRLSDVVNLKLSDIRSDENHIRVQGGKGKKDRTTLLSSTLLKVLRAYYQQYTPKYYLFEGQTGGQYSKRSVQAIVTTAVQKSGISHATPHTLRHSFATHLVQNGTGITHVKELLGHGSIKTTEIYLHLSQNDLRNITSPLDNIWK